MSLYSNSRYVTSLQLDAVDDRGGTEVVRPFLYTDDQVSPDAAVSQIYTVEDGDRLDILAAKFMDGDSSLWWVIADMNEIFGFPLHLTRGTKLKIPTPEVFRQAANGVR